MEIVENDNCFFAIGNNARTNWQMLDNADEHDLFIHLKDSSSPYVIVALRDLKTGSFREADILQGCKLCKQNSSKKLNTREKVMFTEVKNVKKGKRIGSAVVSQSTVLSV